MADVTINELTRGTPAGGNVLPYSSGANTLSVPVSAIFQNGCVVGIGTAAPLMPNEGYAVKSGLEIYNNVTAGVKLTTQKGHGFIRFADNNFTSNLIIDADSGSTSSGNTELLMRIRQTTIIRLQTNKVTITQPLEVTGDVRATNTPKMWVSFDGTRDTSGAVSITNTDRLIRQSGGISSVTRTALGQYRINFSQATVDTNYFIIANSMCDIGIRTVNAQPANGTFTVDHVTVACVLNNDTSTYDAPIVSVLIYKG